MKWLIKFRNNRCDGGHVEKTPQGVYNMINAHVGYNPEDLTIEVIEE